MKKFISIVLVACSAFVGVSLYHAQRDMNELNDSIASLSQDIDALIIKIKAQQENQ